MLIAKTPAIGSFLSKNPKATTTNERQLVTLKASPCSYTFFSFFPWKKRFSGEIPRAMLAALELLNSFLLLHGWIHSPNPKLSCLWWLWKDVVKRESATQWTNMPITYPSPSLPGPMLCTSAAYWWWWPCRPSWPWPCWPQNQQGTVYSIIFSLVFVSCWIAGLYQLVVGTRRVNSSTLFFLIFIRPNTHKDIKINVTVQTH